MMMEYFKRRFSANETPLMTSMSLENEYSEGKTKVLLVIDTEEIDWKKYFQNRRILADHGVRVEQAEFQDLHLMAYSNDGVRIEIDRYEHGQHIVRSFRPDFVLVRQNIRDVDVDWLNIILGMQYGGVPSINSMRALYNFQDKPWIFAELLKIQQRLGVEKFPLIPQAYFPNYRKMFVSPQIPSVIKIGQAHQGLGKIKINNLCDYHDVTGVIEVRQCYSTIEPFIPRSCEICIQKIGQNYRAFSRRSLSNHWNIHIGSSIIEEIEMTDRYRFWIDEVSQLFGGLDLCAIELVQEKSGKEWLISIHDSTMKFFPQTLEDDCQRIAQLIIHKMEIYSRPNREVTILKRIASFDDLPKFPQNIKLTIGQNGMIQRIPKAMHMNNERRFSHLKQIFARVLNDFSPIDSRMS